MGTRAPPLLPSAASAHVHNRHSIPSKHPKKPTGDSNAKGTWRKSCRHLSLVMESRLGVASTVLVIRKSRAVGSPGCRARLMEI